MNLQIPTGTVLNITTPPSRLLCCGLQVRPSVGNSSAAWQLEESPGHGFLDAEPLGPMTAPNAALVAVLRGLALARSSGVKKIEIRVNNGWMVDHILRPMRCPKKPNLAELFDRIEELAAEVEVTTWSSSVSFEAYRRVRRVALALVRVQNSMHPAGNLPISPALGHFIEHYLGPNLRP